MKKVYLSMVVLGLGASISFGQYAPKALTANDMSRVAPKATENHATPKAVGTTFYTNDFSNAASWTINNSGQTGAQFGWTIDATRDGWWAPATAIASTSEGNFAELSNGNPTLATPSQALDVTYTMTTALPISLATSGTQVSLEFLQYGARFNDLQEIQISTNGTTFIPVGNNNSFSVLSSTGGSAYPNPSTKTINLAPYLSGATQVWIRFSWTTNFPTQATNANVWVTYGWYIDDVKLMTNADYDLSVDGTYWGTAGLNYYQIPTSQIAPIDFTANVSNIGTQAMTNVKLNIDVNSGAATGSSTPVTIASQADDSLAINTSYTPAGIGTYAVTRTLTATNADDVPTNNTFAPITFSVNNYIYARDNGVYAGTTSNGTDGFEVGNFFDIWNDQSVQGINTRIATGTPVGTEVYGKIYYVDTATGDFTYLTESDPFTVTTAMLNTDKLIVLPDPVQLTANTTYVVVVGTLSPNLRIANAGTSYKQTSFIFDRGVIDAQNPDGTWFYQTGTPVVRLNFDPTLSINENSAFATVGNVYPNPTTGEATINYSLINAAKVAVNVVDITGKTIYTTSVAQNTGANSITFDATSFTSGVYYVTVATEGSTVTKKLIKK
jgi:hypothetical protein